MKPLQPAWRILLLNNVVTTAIALAQDWPLSTLMLPFWLQSVVLGGFHVHRMLSLQQFSTEGFTSNGRRVPENQGGKRSAAWFFAAHYGFFHLFYLGFIVVTVALEGAALTVGGMLWSVVLVLLVSQFLDHRDNLRRDLGGRPNLGGMMFMPYLRIVPMHLIVFAGTLLGPGSQTLLIFMGLKTLADLGMHAVELALQRGARTVTVQVP